MVNFDHRTYADAGQLCESRALFVWIRIYPIELAPTLGHTRHAAHPSAVSGSKDETKSFNSFSKRYRVSRKGFNGRGFAPSIDDMKLLLDLAAFHTQRSPHRLEYFFGPLFQQRVDFSGIPVPSKMASISMLLVTGLKTAFAHPRTAFTRRCSGRRCETYKRLVKVGADINASAHHFRRSNSLAVELRNSRKYAYSEIYNPPKWCRLQCPQLARSDRGRTALVGVSPAWSH